MTWTIAMISIDIDDACDWALPNEWGVGRNRVAHAPPFHVESMNDPYGHGASDIRERT
jgi:hypothetical protein